MTIQIYNDHANTHLSRKYTIVMQIHRALSRQTYLVLQQAILCAHQDTCANLYFSVSVDRKQSQLTT